MSNVSGRDHCDVCRAEYSLREEHRCKICGVMAWCMTWRDGKKVVACLGCSESFPLDHEHWRQHGND